MLIGTSYSQSNQVNIGKKNIPELLSDLENASEEESITIHIELSRSYQSNSLYQAQKYARKALYTSEKIKDETLMIRSNWAMGSVKYALGEIDSAMFYEQRALDIAIETKNNNLIVRSQINCAIHYTYTEDYKNAIDFYRKSFNQLSQLKDSSLLALVYNNCANIYLEMDFPDSSLYYLNKSIQIKGDIGDIEGKAISLINLGDILFLTNDYSKAENSYKEAISIFEQEKNSYGETYGTIQLAKMYVETDRVDKAELILRRSIDNAEAIGSLPLQLKAFIELGKTFERLGDYKQALKYAHKMYYINDSLSKFKYSSLMKDLESQEKISEEKLKNLELEKTISEEKKRSLLFIVFSACVTLILVVLIVFILKIRKQNKILFEQSIKARVASPKSKSDDPKLESLYLKLIDQLEKEKVYLDSELTIHKLSDKLNSNTKYVSTCINSKFGQNFNSVINTYRVEEAKKCIRNGDMKKYKLATIGERCGFSSISVFNRSFKKETGITPSFFAKSYHKA